MTTPSYGDDVQKCHKQCEQVAQVSILDFLWGDWALGRERVGVCSPGYYDAR